MSSNPNNAGRQRRTVTPWTDRIIVGDDVGLTAPPAWLAKSYERFREDVIHPKFPCYFGTQAEKRGEMFYSFVSAGDLAHLPRTMARFAELSLQLEHEKNNFALFFEPEEEGAFDHEGFQARCWSLLQFLHVDRRAKRTPLAG